MCGVLIGVLFVVVCDLGEMICNDCCYSLIVEIDAHFYANVHHSFFCSFITFPADLKLLLVPLPSSVYWPLFLSRHVMVKVCQFSLTLRSASN